ncbi:hypothetical protein MPH_11914 [Macrophomina phaseolina MS6]|uniref:DUF6594 domain-containing protein n=1 Tax=Macrophomina phaseolina (strain MS6) TaxID=1126212 RepID=K2RD88_MACPH|nr:hypothetical protein MPH_11914 [Macrophomina phaseolina MS6]
MDRQDHRSNYARSWYALSHTQDADGDDKQWRLVQKIMDKLKEYNDVIIQQDSMLRMKAPSQRDLHDVQKYLESSHMGPSALFGSDAEVWGSVERPHSHAKDLITLLGRHEYDSFSQ